MSTGNSRGKLVKFNLWLRFPRTTSKLMRSLTLRYTSYGTRLDKKSINGSPERTVLLRTQATICVTSRVQCRPIN